jgi:hypothetical protein
VDAAVVRVSESFMELTGAACGAAESPAAARANLLRSSWEAAAEWVVRA